MEWLGPLYPWVKALHIIAVIAWMAGLPPGIVDWASGWLHVKLTLVVVLTLYHHALARWRKSFAADANTRPPGFYRAMNEVPTAIMIIIVILVVVKPF
jgi:putative membrane protein